MPTPTERVMAANARTVMARDAEGREYTVRRPDALDRLRLFKALGAELSLNTPYLGMALLASAVTTIDGVPMPPPATEAQLEALVRRLGDSGIGAVADALNAAEREEPGNADPGN